MMRGEKGFVEVEMNMEMRMVLNEREVVLWGGERKKRGRLGVELF